MVSKLIPTKLGFPFAFLGVHQLPNSPWSSILFTSPLNGLSRGLNPKKTSGLWNFFFYFWLKGLWNLWGQKVLEVSAHSISNPRPTPRRKKCLRMNEGNPNCQNVLPRTTLSSTGQNHGRKSYHIAWEHPLEDHQRYFKPYGLAKGE